MDVSSLEIRYFVESIPTFVLTNVSKPVRKPEYLAATTAFIGNFSRSHDLQSVDADGEANHGYVCDFSSHIMLLCIGKERIGSQLQSERRGVLVFQQGWPLSESQ